MRRIVTVFAVILLTTPALAQNAELKVQASALAFSPQNATLEEAVPVHVTQDLIHSPEGRAALEEYRRRVELGLLPVGKGGGFTPGETRSFSVLNFVTSLREQIDFTLVIEGAAFNIWVETAELATSGGFVEEQDWTSLSTALGDMTPPASYDPTMGIIEINEQVFGPPSDVDGSGKMEVLVHDIKDSFDPGAGNPFFTAGFFDPSDLTNSNNADIIHLDTVPAMFSSDGTRKSQDFVLQTLAHEFQHLIFAVTHGALELSFINEGLAEWAEVVNGYTPRTIDYVLKAAELARPLLDFRQDPFAGPTGEDYQRGGLFHHYLSERLSVETVGSIARSNGVGAGNYTGLMIQNGLDPDLFKEFVQGFHVANLINNQALSPNYGYESTSRLGVRATGFQTVDGSLAASSSTSGNLEPGAVRYLKWENVGDFQLDITTTLASQAAHLRPMLFLDPAGGVMQVVTPEAGGETTFVSGDFDEVFLILPHADITITASASFTIDASWATYAGGTQTEYVVYDTGVIDSFLNNGQITIVGSPIGGTAGDFLPIEDEFANVFNVPVGAALIEVEISLFFMDIFGLATTNVRDFTLRIYDDAGGEPGNLLLSKELNFFAAQTAPNMTFQTIDLAGDQGILESQQGALYVSVGNAGTDDNYVYMAQAYSTLSDEDTPSYIFHPFSNTGLNWAPFNAVTDAQGDLIFGGLVVPIRATIDLNAGSTDLEDDFTLPSTVSLSQNYPNPFNPSTSIRFSIPASSDVQLNVFDMLGRQVASLVHGLLPAGEHGVMFDASDLGSGIYLYSITTPSQKVTRTMTLVK